MRILRRQRPGRAATAAGWPGGLIRQAAPRRPGAWAVLVVLAAAAAHGEELAYVLRPDFSAGRLRVELSWQTGNRQRSVLGISERVGPVQNVPGLLRNVLIQDGKARRDGSLWIIEHPPQARIRCTYEVAPPAKAFEQWSYTHLPITTRTFFHGLGAAFLLTPQKASGMPARYETVLRWQLPAGHSAVCSWGPGRTLGQQIDVEDLRTSVYLAGRIQTRTIEEGGRRVIVATAGDPGFSIDDFAAMTSAIVAEQCAFVGEVDFPEFVVTALAAGPPLGSGESRLAGSGLYRSFAMFAAPGTKLDDAVEHLFAHELFHHWNGRLLAAEPPERLVYWFVEGLTDYYALRILRESGRWDAATLAKWINRHLRAYAVNPARNATNDEIERDYWNRRDTVGEVAYQRGLALGLRWHKLARDRKLEGGLDRLLRTLLARARAGPYRISNARLRQAGVELLGVWFGPEFDRYVTRAETVEVPADALAPELIGELITAYPYELGFERERSLRQKRVRGLVKGSAAEQAGLRERDELLAWELPPDTDTPVALRVRRGEQTVEIRYLPRGPGAPALQFRPAGPGSEPRP